MYYSAHKKTRCTVERGIGQWKRRFHVLHGEIRVRSPAYVCRIIEVCAMLHNICKDRHISLPEEEDLEGGEEAPPVVQVQPAARQQQRDGLRYRDAYVDLNFK